MYELTMLSVRLPLNSKLLIVKFWGKQKLYEDFQLHLVGMEMPLTTVIFKDQLYYTAMKKTKTQSTISFNMGKSQRHNVEQKKADRDKTLTLVLLFWDCCIYNEYYKWISI